MLVGRSNNVGKPALWLGLARNATVISAHHHTAEAGRLERHTRDADILVVAAGVPRLITGDMVKPGAIVIDVGINPLRDPETGKVRMVGDVDTESVAAVAEAVSPVPGGVGPDHRRDAAREHGARSAPPGPPVRRLTIRPRSGWAPASTGLAGRFEPPGPPAVPTLPMRDDGRMRGATRPVLTLMSYGYVPPPGLQRVGAPGTAVFGLS